MFPIFSRKITCFYACPHDIVVNSWRTRWHNLRETNKYSDRQRRSRVAYIGTNKRVFRTTMKVIVKQWHAIAQWQWDTGKTDENGDPEEDVCGICRVPFEGCCPTCRVPGDDCPLSRSLVPSRLPVVAHDSPTFQVWGECSHVFHMHCLLKWIATAASKQQCPMDRRVWGAISLSLFTYCSWTHGTHIYTVTAERKISTSDS